MRKAKKTMSLLLVLALVFSSGIAVFGSEEANVDPDCILQESMDYLCNTIGPRLTGTITELRACEYLKAQFEKIDDGDNVYEISLDEYVLNWVPAKGLLMNPASTTAYGYLFTNDRAQYGVVYADIPGGGLVGNANPNNANFRSYSGGLFHDFGAYSSATASVSSLPLEADIIEAGGIVYGTIRFNMAVTNVMINNAINYIKNAYTTPVDVAGFFVARTDNNRTTSNAFGFTSNDLPAGVSSYTTATTSVVGLSLYDLERAVVAGEAGKITRVSREDPETGWLTYARKYAADKDNPDLIMIFTSHIDTVRSSPGAQDTATGVTAALELARRYKDVDTGNIELIFMGMGGEEYNDFSGATHLIDMLRAEGKDKIAINLNMDVMTSGINSVNVLGEPQDTYAVGTLQFQERYQFPNWRNASYGDNLGTATSAFNLPAHLLVTFSEDVEWPTHINNCRIFNWGASDHAMFAYFGIDATRSTTAARGGNFSISGSNVQIYGWRYHSARDSMEDYSYDNHLKATNLMANAIEKAMELEVTKRAKFEAKYSKNDTELKLGNAEQIFKTYEAVNARFVGVDSGAVYNFVFTKDDSVFELAGSEELEAVNVVATGTGRSNIASGLTNTFTTKLVGSVDDATPTVVASIGANGMAHIGDPVEYTLALSDAENVLAVDFEFVIDGNMLAASSFEALNGFTALEPITWTDNGDGTWTGAVKFGYQAGDSQGYTADGSDIAKFVFGAKGLGEAKLEITKLQITGYDENANGGLGAVVYYKVIIEVGQGTTVLYNKYDLNKDGTVDLIDVGILLLYVGYTKDDPEWDTLTKVVDKNGKGITPSDCDVNGDGEIDMADIVQLMANLG